MRTDVFTVFFTGAFFVVFLAVVVFFTVAVFFAAVLFAGAFLAAGAASAFTGAFTSSAGFVSAFTSVFLHLHLLHAGCCLYLLTRFITSSANAMYSFALRLLFLNSTTGSLLSWDHSMELSTRIKDSKR